MKKEYTLEEALERIKFLEIENNHIKEQLEDAKIELEVKREIVEGFESGKKMLEFILRASKSGLLWS